MEDQRSDLEWRLRVRPGNRSLSDVPLILELNQQNIEVLAHHCQRWQSREYEAEEHVPFLEQLRHRQIDHSGQNIRKSASLQVCKQSNFLVLWSVPWDLQDQHSWKLYCNEDLHPEETSECAHGTSRWVHDHGFTLPSHVLPRRPSLPRCHEEHAGSLRVAFHSLRRKGPGRPLHRLPHASIREDLALREQQVREREFSLLSRQAGQLRGGSWRSELLHHLGILQAWIFQCILYLQHHWNGNHDYHWQYFEKRLALPDPLQAHHNAKDIRRGRWVHHHQ